MWVAVGAGNNTIAYSINGQYWYPSNNSTYIFSATTTGGLGVAWNGSMWVAVGGGQNTIAYSLDGINWTGATNSTTIFSNSGNGIACNGSTSTPMWVAVGQGINSIAYSSNGINWAGATNSITIFSNSGNGIAWNGDMWVAVGAGKSNTIAYSTDGQNWTGATNSISGGNSTTIFSTSGNGIAWNGLMWVAVGSGTNNTIAYSIDGKEWTGGGNSIFSSSGNAVTWYKAYNTWIAVGNGTSNTIAYSTDGINWKGSSNPTSIFPVTGSYGMAIASTSSIVFYTNQGNANNIATITPPVSGSSQQLTITDVGSFQIQAELPATSNYLPAIPIQSNTITITPQNVSITPNFLNFTFVYGQEYNLALSTINNTDTNPAPIITYTIVSQGGNGTFSSVTSNSCIFTTNAVGNAYITINVSQTQNFYFTSKSFPIYINPAPASITLNGTWMSNYITFPLQVGSSFTPSSAIGSNTNTDYPGPAYFYNSSNTNVATVNGNSITCIAPGSFYFTITSPATTNFSQYNINTLTFIVSVIPEIIVFNNPILWPINTNVGGAGEYGIILGFPAQSWPNGFSNYSQVTITNAYNESITFSGTVFSNLCNTNGSGQYVVLFGCTQPGGMLGNSIWNTSTAGNIGYVSFSAVADGAKFAGTTLDFVFSGNNSNTGPQSLSVTWNSGSINLQAGQVCSYYYSIALGSPFSSTPGGLTVNNGSFIVGWSGYGVTNYNETVNDMINPNYFPYYPVSGSTPNQAWGISGAINTQALFDGNGNAYYPGIIKILYPNY